MAGVPEGMRPGDDLLAPGMHSGDIQSASDSWQRGHLDTLALSCLLVSSDNLLIFLVGALWQAKSTGTPRCRAWTAIWRPRTRPSDEDRQAAARLEGRHKLTIHSRHLCAFYLRLCCRHVSRSCAAVVRHLPGCENVDFLQGGTIWRAGNGLWLATACLRPAAWDGLWLWHAGPRRPAVPSRAQLWGWAPAAATSARFVRLIPFQSLNASRRHWSTASSRHLRLLRRY